MSGAAVQLAAPRAGTSQCSKQHGVGRALHGRSGCEDLLRKLAESAACCPHNWIWQQVSRSFRPWLTLVVERLACCPNIHEFAENMLTPQVVSRQGGARDQPAGWTKRVAAGCQCRASFAAHNRNPPRQAACWGHLPGCVLESLWRGETAAETILPTCSRCPA